MMRVRSAVLLLGVLVLCCVSIGSVLATEAGTAFTYQGKLTGSTGIPMDGSADFRFTLWDAESGGRPVGTAIQMNAVTVTGGLFSVALDFGALPFTGSSRWIEIEVRSPSGIGLYSLLSPRQQISTVPYALYALNTADSDAHTVDALHASVVPTANTLLALNAIGKFPNSVLFTGAGNGLDADLFDGQHGAFYQNAANLNAGVLADVRLSANVALLGGAQTFTGAKTFSNASNSFTGSGAGLTALNASNLSQGALPSARLGGTYSQALTFPNTSNLFYGNGANLTDLNASNLSTGTVADVRLSGNVPRLDASQEFTGSNSFTYDIRAPRFVDSDNIVHYVNPAGTSNLYNLIVAGTLDADINAKDLTTGTLPDARLSSNVVLLNTLQTFTADKYFGGKVGIGTTNPAYRLHVEYDVPGNQIPVIYGKNATTDPRDGVGVMGEAKSLDGSGVGVKGSGGYAGVWGQAVTDSANSVRGITGYAASGAGGTAYGVYGSAYGEGTACGVYGTTTGGSSRWAGFFAGDVHITGTLSAASKSFKIDHPLDPENKTLTHFCIEGPEMMNVYSGNVVTGSDGYATVRLPDYFEAANRDFRYQLTVIGQFAQAIVADEIADNSFRIQTDKPSVKVSWQVTGVRNDKWAQGNTGPVEQMKPASEKGKYLSPEAFGKPREMGIGYLSEAKLRSAR